MLNYLQNGSLLSRKWYITETIDAFRCIKVRITPVSSKRKNPLQFKTARSYHIIHKAERQLFITESGILTEYWVCMSIIDFLTTHA